jgi:hypothetical protein
MGKDRLQAGATLNSSQPEGRPISPIPEEHQTVGQCPDAWPHPPSGPEARQSGNRPRVRQSRTDPPHLPEGGEWEAESLPFFRERDHLAGADGCRNKG